MKLFEAIDIQTFPLILEGKHSNLSEAAVGHRQKGRYMGYLFTLTKTDTGYRLDVESVGHIILVGNQWTVFNNHGREMGTILDSKPDQMSTMKIGEVINILVRMLSDDAEYGRVLSHEVKI